MRKKWRGEELRTRIPQGRGASVDRLTGSGSINQAKEEAKLLKLPHWSVTKIIIDLVTVFDAILTSRQTREKLQCLYENLMSNNFRKMAVLKKISIVN